MTKLLNASFQGLSIRHWLGLGFVYWLAVVTMLEPGNVLNALEAGLRPHWGREATRLLAAAAIGAAATPVLLVVAARFPLQGAMRLWRLAIQLGAVLLLAPTLILVSCFVAAWAFEGRLVPTAAEIGLQMTANLLLLVFCLSLFLALIQLWRRSAPPAETAVWPRVLTVRDRGRVTILDLAAVEWIETQGNYQALYAEGRAHLLRETSHSLEARLDPARFVRIHRRVIVAPGFIREVEALSNGDGIVRLKSGAALRLSRNHRSALRQRLAELG